MEFNRYLFPILLEHLVPNKVNLIFGTRRVGKTYLIISCWPTLATEHWYWPVKI